MSLKVSVVVPVYNPGQYIEVCITSLVGQSLPADEYEICFVDDGSTDETPARLDKLAAEHANVRVIHQEPSGWAGKPRNVGIAATTGEYIMFVDCDDYLAAEALERLYEYGVANGADVVIGKMAGKGRAVPRELFRKNRPRASVLNAPLIDSLSPHKMVRRAFLDRIGLRYLEGRRRLEDHAFFAEAFLRAANVSVLSDYVCYYHTKRDDAANSSFRPIDPVGYFGNLREALDIVDAYTDPGPLRDKLYRRWLRNEIVERLRGHRFLRMDPAYRQEMCREMRRASERFGPGVAAGLTPIQRVVAELLAADRLDDLETLADWEVTVKPVGELQQLAWFEGALRVGFTVEYAAGREQLTFRQDGSRTTLALPIVEAGPGIATQFEKSKVDLVIRERTSAAEFYQPIEFERELVPTSDPAAVRLRLRATARIDPRTAVCGGRIGAGIWDVVIRFGLSGWNKEVRLGAVRQPGVEHGRRAAVIDGQSLLPYWTTPYENLSIDVQQATKRLRYDLSTVRADHVTAGPDLIALPLPVYVDAAGAARLRMTHLVTRAAVDLDATLVPSVDGCVLQAVLAGRELPAGRYRISVALAARADDRPHTDLPLTMHIDNEGGLVVRSAKTVGRRPLAHAALRTPLVRRTLRRPIVRRAMRRPLVRRALRKVREALL